MIEDKKILIRWHHTNKNHYINKGYIFTKLRDEFYISQCDLPNNSELDVTIKCDICNKIYEKKYFDIIRSRNRSKDGLDYCKECLNIKKRKANPNRHLFEHIQNLFDKRNYILVSEDYKNRKEHLKYICKKHINYGVQNISFGNFLKGQGCKYCGIEKFTSKTRLDYGFVKTEFERKGYILMSNIYKNTSIPLEYICKKHESFGIQTISYGSLKQDHGCFYCYLDRISGENNYNYNHNLTQEDRQRLRKYPEYIEWIKNVYNRDNYKCQICGEYSGKLNAHHLFNYKDYPDLRTQIDNGITLCNKHHREFHKTFRYKNNTPEQFEQFKDLILSEKEVS